MALKLDSTINKILEILSEKYNLPKSTIYFLIDYKFKKIRDLMVFKNRKEGKLKPTFKDFFSNRITEDRRKLMNEEKLIFRKISMPYLLNLKFKENKFDLFNIKFNKEYEQTEQFWREHYQREQESGSTTESEAIKQDNKSESKMDNGLLGFKELF